VPIATKTLARVGAALPGAVTNQRQLARVLRFLRAMDLPIVERYYRWVGYFTGPRRAALFERDGEGLLAQRLASAADDAGARDPVERAMATDLVTYLPGDLLPKMDIAAMANSLETRSPFLDHEVVEFVASLPRAYKVTALRSKILLRHAMRGVLPAETLRRSKMGFGIPVGGWLRGELRPLLTDVLLASDASVTRYVRRDAVERLVREHLDTRADHTPFLWCLLMLEMWFRERAN